MKLSEFIRQCKKLYPGIDPEIKIVGQGGFKGISVLPRSSYYDDHPAFDIEFEKGDFVCLEINDEPEAWSWE